MIQFQITHRSAGTFTVLLDDEDADLAEHRWNACKNKKGEIVYASRSGARTLPPNGYLQRIVLERKLGRRLHSGERTDHINRNGFDNRRENLRVASASQNAANTIQSEMTGVRRTPRGDRFSARMSCNGKSSHLGTFDTQEEARAAYKAAHAQCFGEFSPYAQTNIGFGLIQAPMRRAA